MNNVSRVALESTLAVIETRDLLIANPAFWPLIRSPKIELWGLVDQRDDH